MLQWLNDRIAEIDDLMAKQTVIRDIELMREALVIERDSMIVGLDENGNLTARPAPGSFLAR